VLAQEHPEYVPYDVDGEYGQLFTIIEKRYALYSQRKSFSYVTD